MLRLLVALSAGLLVGSVGYGSLTGDPGVSWLWGVSLTLVILSGSLVVVGRSLRGTAVPGSAELAELLRRNGGAPARVDRITRTGLTVNDRPMCELSVTVAPPGEDAYRTTTRLLLDPVELPAFQPGAVVAVARRSRERPEVWVVREPDAGAAAVMDGADRIPPAARVPERPADYTSVPGPGARRPLIPLGRRGRPWRIAAYAVVFLSGLAMVVGPHAAEAGRAVAALGADVDYDDFVYGDRQGEAVEALAAAAGGDLFVELHFFDDGMVFATAPTAPGATTVDDFMYRYGDAEREGPSTIQPEDLGSVLFDASDVDFSGVPDLAAETRRLTGITSPASTSVHVSRETPDPETGEPGPVLVSVSVDDAYHDGSVTFTVAGDVRTMGGGVPGSEAAEYAD
ncbi:hypothetical protein LX16_0736 [Stackebrandtia albiflava]|uniref:Uncharacterized protein n=1 Tax=Stackebrandtia albiflava TaxID=406432 RepID=A0A562VAX0_9ACTN|nr:hypothetical protein [Stackebrandtia albiflava]TWJ15039.1 hypothetical protein LX16_0736 [Stackebrandtia albiflava]